ncbi:MAG: hypothetical protein II255_02960 [Ruminiclostridium sp.]|nr:hypothetical protein [Ruminiclostridium sp.]
MPKKSQEWDIFYILCPQSLLDIMDDPGLTFANRMRLFLALSRLGFHGVAHSCHRKQIDPDSRPGICREMDFDHLYLPDDPHYNEDPFIRMFLDNIESPILRKRFEPEA